jgi:hypothetical protein
MNLFWETVQNLFRRDLTASTVEIVLFLVIVFGFFGLLAIIYHVRQRKEHKRLARVREEKWNRLCRKYNLAQKEIDFLELLADSLEMPDKKYLLIADRNTFHHALEEYSKEERPEADLVQSIIDKTGMKKAESFITEVPLQRRGSKRVKVDTPALIAAIEEETAQTETRMHDLSRGGCRMENPGGRFSAGDDVKISFGYRNKKYRDIPAAVVRTSSNNGVLHLSFGHVKKRKAESNADGGDSTRADKTESGGQ